MYGLAVDARIIALDETKTEVDECPTGLAFRNKVFYGFSGKFLR